MPSSSVGSKVDETRPDQGSSAGQVDVVGQQHGGTGRVADAAATVGEHQPPSTGRSGGANAVHHGGHPAAFIQVGASGEHRGHRAGGGAHQPQVAAVAGDHGGAEPGQPGERTLVQVLAQPFGRLRPTRTQHQGQVDGVDAETGAQGVGGLLSQNVGIAHSSDDIGCGSAPRRSQRSTREQRDCLCDTSLPARGQLRVTKAATWRRRRRDRCLRRRHRPDAARTCDPLAAAAAGRPGTAGRTRGSATSAPGRAAAARRGP